MLTFKPAGFWDSVVDSFTPTSNKKFDVCAVFVYLFACLNSNFELV